MNTFGNIFRFTDFGESHGVAVGGVIDGCPAGLKINFEQIRADLDRRAGRDTDAVAASERSKHEADNIEWLSGIVDGTTLGTPIAFMLKNTDARSSDYEPLRDTYRPGYADLTYQQKYGIRDYRGGGRHDVCIALRAPVIVEAMAAITILDLVYESATNTH